MIRASIKNCKSSLLMFMVLFSFIGTKSYSQDDKKSMSLTVQYSKVMKENSYLSLTAKFKGENGFEPCGNIGLNIYKIDTTGVQSPIKIGAVKTNKDGKVKFIVSSQFVGQSSSYSVKLENDKKFEDTEEIVSIANVNIEASIEKGDSLYTIKARLLSAANKPIAEEALKAGLKRLFGNLAVGGEESYTTDEDGAISVPIEKGLTGIDGKLNFQVVLYESEKYGTVIANINEKFGVPIVDKSSFNERTMWSPPTKTPIFLLIIPNIILVGIWTILTFLLFNLYKIYKSKN